MAADVFIKKLQAFADLPESDRSYLRDLLTRTHVYQAGDVIVAEGDVPADVHVVLSGFVCRYKALPRQRRQIAAFLVPGDFCDLHVFALETMDHSMGCLETSTIGKIARDDVLGILERPAIARALLLSNLIDQAILREWITNIGQRPAAKRMAHLLYELYLRMRMVDLAKSDGCVLPMSQTDLADALGLSLVHTNKSLRQLRLENLLVFRSGLLSILDMDGLRNKSGFNENYLHLGGGKAFPIEAGTMAN